ncbi:tyrosine-type recombinase/integrase [Nocardioides panacisoli]|uniref:Site-specific integrase n=1 Tax=Nocardioides panacisoli TaxID=627624 RepID=A0ABP7J6T4_9ACTN
MTLALVPTRVAAFDATLAPPALVPGPRILGWSETLPDGLTDLDLTRITEAIAAGRAESTRRSYAWQWGRFERWCAERAITSMPATPATVCAYITDFAAQGVAAGTIECACAAIAAEHETEGCTNPIADLAVKAVRRGLRRTLGTAPRRRSRPLNTHEIRRMVDHIDRNTARGARDAALILVGFASALRRSELAGLDLADIEPKPEGLLVRVRKSKTDPEARGQLVGVAHGQHAETDPVTALDGWLAHRGRHPGQLFLGFHYDRIGPRPFTGSGLARMLKERAAAAGIPSERVSGHSLRAGHATTAAMAGVGLDRIAAQTRHSRISTLVEHYIRPLEAMEVTSSRDLGL